VLARLELVSRRFENEGMTSQPVVAGFPEMWQLVHEKYRLFFEATGKLQPIINDMTSQLLTGQLADVVCRMVLAAANTYGAFVTLVLNGYGHDAMKLARSIYETELNILWLKKYPAEVEDYIDYNIIQQKQLYDAMDQEQQQQFPKDSYEEMMKNYTAVLPHFAAGRDKTRPRNEWCRASIYQRAKEAEEYWHQQIEAHGPQVKEVSLYKTYYRLASEIHHGDIGGLIAQVDSEMNVELAPSWSWLEDALVGGLGSLVRCVNEFDEIVQLGFKQRLQDGPNECYVAAVKNLVTS
jgi:hypothetical protein